MCVVKKCRRCGKKGIPNSRHKEDVVKKKYYVVKKKYLSLTFINRCGKKEVERGRKEM